MKLQVLAVAVAASLAFPMAAQADGHSGGNVAGSMKIGGDIGVFYDTAANGGDGAIDELGSEINIDGASEVDGVTYMGHMELDVNGTGSSALRMDEVRVGAKGGFGEVWLGEIDNACDQFDPASNDIWLGGLSNACRGADASSILYKNSFGAADFAVSHNPGEDQSAIAARFGAGPVKVNLAYEDGVATSEGPDESLLVYGVSGDFAGVTLGLQGNDDDFLGVNASYSAGSNTVWADYGDDDGDDVFSLGYRMKHGKMDYIIEYGDDGTDDRTIAGMRYNF